MRALRKAIGAVEGKAAGSACFLGKRGNRVRPQTLDEAFEAEKARLEALQDDPLFAAHLEMLEDPMLREAVDAALAEGLSPADAVRSAERSITAMFEEIEDDYLRARADDVRDLCRGLLGRLEGVARDGAAELPEAAVLVGEEFFPSDTTGLDYHCVRAFVAARGSATSHVAVIARAKGIPALFGVDTEGIREGDRLLVDGDAGTLIIGPTEEEERDFLQETPGPAPCTPLLRPDGSRVKIFGNAGSLPEIDAAMAAGAEGIGLFRTEFLYLASDRFPTEEEQWETYRQAVLHCKGKPLTIRLLDMGADKQPAYWKRPAEENPFLGLRGIRLALAHPEILSVQIRAILRAAAEGPVKILIPMVTDVEELREVKKMIRSCGAAVPTGIMVETPAAVLNAPELAAEADFFSIGTNDLAQYIQVADRNNPQVAAFCNPAAPAVRRAIEMTADAARNAGIPFSVCGEMASGKDAQAYLAGLGVESLSLSSPDQIRARSSAVRSS